MSANPRIRNHSPHPASHAAPRPPLRHHGREDREAPRFLEASFPLVVHSHLRWSFVWQRPQQIHSRLARRHPVLFIEEPVIEDAPGKEYLEITCPLPNLWVVQPRVSRGGSPDAHARALLRSAADQLFRAQFSGAVHWVYTPMMEPQIDLFPRPRAVIYDCMDELSKFAMAPAGLAARERRLLERADLVFAGGPELGAAKARLHPNVHVFGCGVDFEHFASARTATPSPELSLLAEPRLGYMGVIDERLDYALLADIARSFPEATVVLVGPVVKIDPAILPREPNIVYLGARDYAALPELLAGFDVCLMPFAMNEASFFINPTKTLEYLATGRPVVSTPVRDVVRQFRDLLQIADSKRFVEAIRAVLRGERRDPDAGLERARASSWEKTVSAMELYVAVAASARRSGVSSQRTAAASSGY